MWHEEDKMMELVEDMGQAHISSPTKCPVCNELQAHFLMHKNNEANGKGSAWIWCDECKSYSHFGYFVPSWWVNPEFIDVEKLDSYVEYPHSIEKQVDEWIKSLRKNLFSPKRV